MNQSSRLIMTKPAATDFRRFFEINADPEHNLFNPNGPMGIEMATKVFAQMSHHWQEYGFGTWRISEKENPSLAIGFGGLAYRLYGDEMRLNLGYRFCKTYWGKGYATELSKYAIQAGFHELEKNEIFALVRPKHLASIKVLEKCEMKLVGVLDDVPGDDDSLVYKISRANPVR